MTPLLAGRPGTLVGRHLAGVAAPALAVVLIAGCAGSGSPATTSGSAGSPAGQSQAGGPGQGATRLDALAFTQRLTDAMRAKSTVKVTSNVLVKLNGHLKMTSSGADLDMFVTIGKTPAHVIVVGGVMYMGTSTAAGGNLWSKVDSGSGASDMSAMLQQWSEPGVVLKGLEGKVQAVRGGTQTVDGVPTTQYTVTLDPEQFAVAAKNGGLGMGGATAGATAVTTYYLDDAWLPRKIVTQVADQSEQSQPITVTYSDWGQPVDITAPNPSEVQ